MISKTIFLAVLAALAGCNFTGSDPNDKPTYGETGLPLNCRAIVQANIDSFRSGQYTASQVMDSLERNCGAQGYSWKVK